MIDLGFSCECRVSQSINDYFLLRIILYVTIQKLYKVFNLFLVIINASFGGEHGRTENPSDMFDIRMRMYAYPYFIFKEKRIEHFLLKS